MEAKLPAVFKPEFEVPFVRQFFRDTYSSVVEACYDDIDAWERDHGIPEANPNGAELRD